MPFQGRFSAAFKGRADFRALQHEWSGGLSKHVAPWFGRYTWI